MEKLKAFVPVASKIAGRDLGPDIDLFFDARAAVGKALSDEGRAFFVENWRSIPEFMETEAGQKALRRFLGNWETEMKK